MTTIHPSQPWLLRSAVVAFLLTATAFCTPVAEARGLVQFRISNNTHAAVMLHFKGTDGSTLRVDVLHPYQSKLYSMKHTNAQWSVGGLIQHVTLHATHRGVTRVFTVRHTRSYRLEGPPLRLIDVGMITIP